MISARVAFVEGRVALAEGRGRGFVALAERGGRREQFLLDRVFGGRGLGVDKLPTALIEGVLGRRGAGLRRRQPRLGVRRPRERVVALAASLKTAAAPAAPPWSRGRSGF